MKAIWRVKFWLVPGSSSWCFWGLRLVSHWQNSLRPYGSDIQVDDNQSTWILEFTVRWFSVNLCARPQKTLMSCQCVSALAIGMPVKDLAAWTRCSLVFVIVQSRFTFSFKDNMLFEPSRSGRSQSMSYYKAGMIQNNVTSPSLLIYNLCLSKKRFQKIPKKKKT